MARTTLDLNGQTDLPITESNLLRLGDNSIVDDLHRHSKLVAPDGVPDPALYIDNDGKIILSATAAGLYVGGVAVGDLVITSGKILQNIAQATIDNIRIDGANIGHTSDTDLLALAANKLTINGALELTKGLKLPIKTTLAVNSEFAVGECWIYLNTGNSRYYFAFKDENASGKAVELGLDVTLT